MQIHSRVLEPIIRGITIRPVPQSQVLVLPPLLHPLHLLQAPLIPPAPLLVPPQQQAPPYAAQP